MSDLLEAQHLSSSSCRPPSGSARDEARQGHDGASRGATASMTSFFGRCGRAPPSQPTGSARLLPPFASAPHPPSAGVSMELHGWREVALQGAVGDAVEQAPCLHDSFSPPPISPPPLSSASPHNRRDWEKMRPGGNWIQRVSDRRRARRPADPSSPAAWGGELQSHPGAARQWRRRGSVF